MSLTSSALVAPPDLRGEQRPRLLTVPPRVTTEIGRDAVLLARKAGLSLNPWQEFVLEESLASGDDGLHSAEVVGMVVSRQNGKGQIIVARQLAGLFLLDEPLQVYTSHLFTTTKEMWLRLRGAIQHYPPLAKLLLKATGPPSVSIEFKSGARVLFLARTAGGSGRGYSVDGTLYIDEAMYLSEQEQEALVPTTTASRNPQVWYAGSAGIGEQSRAFSRIRQQGINGESDRLLWAEWSVPDDADPDDQASWGVANPGMGLGQTSVRKLRGYRNDLSPSGFAREYLGVGDWPADDADSRRHPISPEQWADIQDPHSTALDPVVLSVAVSVDGSRSAICTAGLREDGLRHIEVVDHRAGVHWLPERLVQLRDDHKPSCIVINSAGRAGSLIPALVEAGMTVHSGKGEPATGDLVLLGGPDVTAAFGAFVSGVTEEPTSIRHRPNPKVPEIATAVAHASTRWVGQAQAWDGKNLADISPLEGVTLAAYGHAKYGTTDSSGGWAVAL